MITMKFGGTSMGSSESIGGHVVPIIRKSRDSGEQPTVVVSAMSGITNKLLDAEKEVCGNNPENLNRIITEIREKHEKVIADLVCDPGWRSAARDFLGERMSYLSGLGERVGQREDISIEDSERIIAMGEQLSAHTLGCALNSQEVPAVYIDLAEVIPEYINPENPDFYEQLAGRIRERIMPMLKEGAVPVMTGYFGPFTGGIVGAVGRGYSDLCGSVAAVAAGADEYRNYTDVDGIYSANPKDVKDARIVRSATFREVAELAGNGGKVLHPTTVTPVLEKGIPIRVMNTFNEQSRGTMIAERGVLAAERALNSVENFKFVSCKKGVTRIDIETPKMLGESGYLQKIGEVFARHGVVVDLISTSEISVTFTVDKAPKDMAPLMVDLEEIGKVEVRNGSAVINVVGEELRSDQGIIGAVLTALSSNGVWFNMISMGNGRISFSLLVADEDAEKAVRLIHDLRQKRHAIAGMMSTFAV